MTDNSIFTVVVTGVGGQGTVLASRIISGAAALSGRHVVGSETIGMAQRGGCVASHISAAESPVVRSPITADRAADLVIAFEPAEAVRALRYLKPDGILVASVTPVPPTTPYTYDMDALIAAMRAGVGAGVLELVDATEILRSVGSQRALNTVLVGAAARYLPFGHIEESLRAAVKPAYVEMNVRALRAGMEYTAGSGSNA
jgi:indolepyruvate ferredoxin oxidoreductase beta subunit